jgi:hypothetical protein
MCIYKNKERNKDPLISFLLAVKTGWTILINFQSTSPISIEDFKLQKDFLNQVLLLFVITSKRGMYNYTPETNHVSRVYSVAPIAWLQFMVHAMLLLTLLIIIIIIIIIS